MDTNINVNRENLYVKGSTYNGTLPALARAQRENFVYISDTIHAFGVIRKSGVCDVITAKERFNQVGYATCSTKGISIS